MKNQYQQCAVIFLDILGTKDRASFQEKFVAHKLLHEEVRENESRQRAVPHVIHTRTLRSFSDCAFIIYTYKEGILEEKKNDLNLLFIALYNTSLSIVRLLKFGFLVRGGVSLGHAFIDELGFFGPAIECSHELESNKEKAIYPRVILDPDIGERLYTWERNQEMNSVAAVLFSSPPRLILKDTDGWYYLNVFYQLEMSGSVQFHQDSYNLDEVKAAIDEAIAKSRLRHSDNPRIMEKMHWLESRLSTVSLKTRPGITPITFTA